MTLRLLFVLKTAFWLHVGAENVRPPFCWRACDGAGCSRGNFLWKVKERLIGQEGKGLVRRRPTIGSSLLWYDALVPASSPHPPSFCLSLPSSFPHFPPLLLLTSHSISPVHFFFFFLRNTVQERTKQSFDSKMQLGRRKASPSTKRDPDKEEKKREKEEINKASKRVTAKVKRQS